MDDIGYDAYELLVLDEDTGSRWKVIERRAKNHGNLETLTQIGAHKYMDTKWKVISVIYTDEHFR